MPRSDDDRYEIQVEQMDRRVYGVWIQVREGPRLFCGHYFQSRYTGWLRYRGVTAHGRRIRVQHQWEIWTQLARIRFRQHLAFGNRLPTIADGRGQYPED